jgi:hypothetical protein
VIVPNSVTGYDGAGSVATVVAMDEDRFRQLLNSPEHMFHLRIRWRVVLVKWDVRVAQGIHFRHRGFAGPLVFCRAQVNDGFYAPRL